MNLSCDEKIDVEALDQRTENEKLLTRDWQYQYILMDADTIRNFIGEGEPTLDEERDTDVRRNFLRFTTDQSYELFTNNGFTSMGFEENYQPNFGFWDLEESGSVPILIHNKLFPYEKRYEVMTLTEDLMIRRLIGSRTTYLVYEISPLDFEVIEVEEWIEVFVPKTD